jgi:hypothetical protein
MNTLTWDMLECSGRGIPMESSKREFSVETLGKLIAWASCLYASSEPADADDMFSILADEHSWSSMPKSIAESFHIDWQLDGSRVVEATRMMAAAQSSLAVGRLNPDTLAPIYKITPLVAQQLLDNLEGEHPEEVKWVKQQILDKYHSSQVV